MPRRFFFFVPLLLGSGQGLAPAFAAPLPTPLEPLERKLLRTIRRADKHTTPILDASLVRAAHRLLDQPTRPIKDVLDEEPWSCVNPVRLQGQAESPTELLPLLEQTYRSRTMKTRSNRVGVAVRQSDKGLFRAEVLLGACHVRWRPSDLRHLDQGAPERSLQGRLLKQSPGTLWAVFQSASYTTKKKVHPKRGGKFELPLPRRLGPSGRIQLIFDGERGPQVLSNLRWGSPTPSSHSPAVNEPSPEEALRYLILAEREWADRTPLTFSPELRTIARAHARDMVDRGYFAHISPEGVNAENRVQRGGLSFTRILENLAVAPTPQAIVEQWLESPSHAQNLMDEGIDAFGVGVVPNPDGGWVAVWIGIAFAVDTSDAALSQTLWERLQTLRAERKLPPLARDPTLDRLAQNHVRKQPAASSSDDSALLQAIWAESDVSEVAIDRLQGPQAEAIRFSTHATGPYERGGIGVYHSTAPGMTEIWVTVVYAVD